MQDLNSWEVVVSSLNNQLKNIVNQLKNIEATLENQNSSVKEYLQQNGKDAHYQLLEAQIRSTQISFNRMENKLHDMVIYLCRAITVSKVISLSNLLGEVEHGVEQ